MTYFWRDPDGWYWAADAKLHGPFSTWAKLQEAWENPQPVDPPLITGDQLKIMI